MKLSRFTTIVDAYGAAPERWPEDERDAALSLARSSLPAARALNEARALDARLSREDAFGLDGMRLDALHSRIVAAARPRIDSLFKRWFGFDLTPTQLWPSLAGLALASVLGFTIGIGGLLQVDSDQNSDDIALLSPIDLPAIGQ